MGNKTVKQVEGVFENFLLANVEAVMKDVDAQVEHVRKQRPELSDHAIHMQLQTAYLYFLAKEEGFGTLVIRGIDVKEKLGMVKRSVIWVATKWKAWRNKKK